MPISRNLFSGTRKYLWGLILLSVICAVCAAFTVSSTDDYDFTRREILLRRIGHEVLLQSGDSISRVLPVKKISENEYRITFENNFTFQPESLVNITSRLLAKDSLVSDYVVNVLNCGTSDVVYGFAISKNKKNDIVTCKGRKLPIACYIIQIKFKPSGIHSINSSYVLGSLSFLAFVGFICFRSVKPRRTLPEARHADMLTLGNILFDAKNRKLLINGKATDLTVTETQVLLIFAQSPNETIERSRLQKEIWEDEGVIVGRSLDMFISKLRKKLEVEPTIKIVVI